MTDPVLYGASREEHGYSLDINIKNGYLETLPRPEALNTQKQRRAVLAFQIQGTIPGDWGRGVNWAGLMAKGNQIPMSQVMVEVQNAIQDGGSNSTDTSFTVPIIQANEQGVNLQLLTVSPEDMQEIPNA